MAAKIHSQREIYLVLEQALRNSPTPLTVSELLDLPDVRAAAIAEYGNDVRVYTDRLSNALGLMWRREVIVRYPAPEKANSQARFMYEWPKETPPRPVLPSTFPKAKTGVVITAQKLLGHKDMSMTEDYIKARETEVVKPHTRNERK